MKWLFYILSPAFFVISYFFPKSETTWCFGAWFGRKYADNSRYLYEYVIRRHPEIKAVWVSESPEIVRALRKSQKLAVNAYSWSGLILQLRARYFFCSVNSKDFFFAALTPSSRIIQLWHGSPLKKIGFDAPDSSAMKLTVARLRSWTTDKYEMVISPSPTFDEIYRSAFALKKHQIVRCGYPRNDGLFIGTDRRREIRGALGGNDLGQLVIYLPTHRSEGKDVDVISNLIQQFRAHDQQIAAADLRIIVKPHFHDAKRIGEWSGDGVSVSHDLLGFDLYQVLASCDGLITDYSSVFLDFDIVGLPTYFLSPDLEWYQSQGRGLNFKYDDFAERHAKSVKELIPDVCARRGHLRKSLVLNSDKGGDFSRKLLEELQRSDRVAT